ncbi:hypothetical protein DVA76_19620, partial [Acinetobacter baumannii]
ADLIRAKNVNGHSSFSVPIYKRHSSDEPSLLEEPKVKTIANKYSKTAAQVRTKKKKNMKHFGLCIQKSHTRYQQHKPAAQT